MLDALILESRSPEETFRLGEAIGRALRGGEVIALTGQLGAGKTHLVKGIAAGNGLDDPRRVTSPTFVLVNEYLGRLRLFHLDLYRLSGAAELQALGFDEMIGPGSAAVIEWADRAAEALPDDVLDVEISVVGELARRFRIRARGRRAAVVLAALQTPGAW